MKLLFRFPWAAPTRRLKLSLDCCLHTPLELGVFALRLLFSEMRKGRRLNSRDSQRHGYKAGGRRSQAAVTGSGEDAVAHDAAARAGGVAALLVPLPHQVLVNHRLVGPCWCSVSILAVGTN